MSNAMQRVRKWAFEDGVVLQMTDLLAVLRLAEAASMPYVRDLIEHAEGINDDETWHYEEACHSLEVANHES